MWRVVAWRVWRQVSDALDMTRWHQMRHVSDALDMEAFATRVRCDKCQMRLTWLGGSGLADVSEAGFSLRL